MARLEEPPRTRLSPHADTDASIDGDAATQQLLDETRASASKASRPNPPPQSAAVLGANLLNAARIDFRHSSPTRMPRKPGSGRLNRISSSTEPRRQHLARPRGNIWVFPASPEKSPFTPQQGEAGDEPGLDENIDIDDHDHEAPTRALEDPPHKAAWKRKSAEEQHAESRRAKSAKLQKHVKVKSRVQTKKVSDTGTHQPARESLTKSHPDVRIAAHKNSSTKHGHSGIKTTVSNPPARKDVAESAETATSPTSIRRTRSKPQSSNVSASRLRSGTLLKRSIPTKATKISKASHLDAEHSSDDGQGENSQDREDEQENDSDEAELLQEEASAENVYIPKPLRRVFEFLGLEKRPGTCQTERCRDIKSTCEKTTSLFRKQKLSLKEVNRKTETVQAMLRTVSAAQKDEYGAVKADMYAYVFRSLSKLLVSLYEYFAERDGDFTESLRHMRILFPFVHDIVALKDLLSSWNVTVPQRYRGDRLIADVNLLLIAPLRDLETLLNKRLSQLEQNERDVEKLADLEQQIEKEDMEAVRRHEAVQARIKRRDRWQNLHVARMQCEPDIRRRLPYLGFIEPENLKEKDANGVVFERVPVFKDRNSTLYRWPRSTMTARRSWSDEQVEALIGSLQKSPGPDVFYDVIDSCCRPGGPLREFNVTDITDKAAWIRSSYVKLHQERSWEVPDWVTQIPVLP